MPIVRQLLHQAKPIKLFLPQECVYKFLCHLSCFRSAEFEGTSKWSVNPRIPLSLSFCIEYVYENNASSCNNNAAITRSLRRRTHSLVCFFGMVGRDFKKLKGCKKSPSNYIIFHYLSHKGPTIILIASCINAK